MIFANETSMARPRGFPSGHLGLGNPPGTCQEGVEARYDFFLNRDQGRDRMLPGGSGRGVDVQWRNANCDFPEKNKKVQMV